MMKVFVIISTLSFVALFGLVGGKRGLTTPAQQPVSPVQTSSVFAIGRIESVGEEVHLRPFFTGEIVDVAVQEGEFVEREQLLVQLDDRQFQYEVALAEAELVLAQARLQRLHNGAHKFERAEAVALYRARAAELEREQATWKRTRTLHAGHVITDQQADNQRAQVGTAQGQAEAAKARAALLSAPPRQDELRMAEAEVAAARARVDLAQVQLDHTRIVAPQRGQVLELNVERGELAGPESVEPAVIMADTSRFRVRAFVEELDAPRILLGMRASITADGIPERVFSGTVTGMSARMSPKMLTGDAPDERYDTKTRQVWISMEEVGPFVVGLRVDVMIDATKDGGEQLSTVTEPPQRYGPLP